VRFGVVCYLIAHAWHESEFATIPEFSLQFTLQTKENMPFATPVVSQVSGRVLDHADSNASELLSAPVRDSAFAFVLGLLDLRPVYNIEWNAGYAHRYVLLVMPLSSGFCSWRDYSCPRGDAV
jgi:hypothetical protein